MVRNVLSYSGNGLRDWLIQRVSAVILTIYVLFISAFFVAHPHVEYSTWHDLHANHFMRVFNVLMLLSLILHAWVGVWTVCTDYIKCRCLRLGVEVLVVIALIWFFIWGIEIFWSV